MQPRVFSYILECMIVEQDKSAAIIGMGCIFPKADGLREYWNLLFSGTDAITDIPEETHFSLKDFYNEDPGSRDHIYCRRGGFIPAVTFDPSRYGLPPKNLEATDTSQLLGLMVAEMALKDAGYPADSDLFIKKRTNVILGVTGTQELVIPLGARLSHPAWKRALADSGIFGEKKEEILHRLECSYNQWQENSFPGLLGNVVAGRIANRLDLGGTNTVVDAACASSLSAVNTALMELGSGKCDMSITGGVDTLNDIFMHMCFSKTGVLSKTSDARPFSADADGTVLGEGIGMVVLKRLSDAVRDKDRIYAVIRGVGSSSDGSTGGIYAPDADGQKRALQAAYREADVDPSTVEFIEAHGTGTRVGDKIEFTALKDFMKQDKNSCAVGSVKSNIGHTKAAAGVAGVIKNSLSLYHKTLFPTLKAGNPDPELDIEQSSFYLIDQAKPWIHGKETKHPRRAGVSAFGFGGSNFHAVLEEYDRSKHTVSWDGSVQIAAFSSNDLQELSEGINAFIHELADTSQFDQRESSEQLARLTAALRSSFKPEDKYRLTMVTGRDDDPKALAEKAVQTLNSSEKAFPDTGGIYFGSNESPEKLGFVYPGQGSQYTYMGRDLACVFPEAMEAFSLFESAFFRQYAGDGSSRLSDYIFPLPSYQMKNKAAQELLTATDVAQPAIGAVSLAITRVLERFNVTPDFTCGHSFGELSALAASGRIDERAFAELSCIRGSLMAEAASLSPEKGGMLAVKAPLEKIEAFAASKMPELVLANRNSPDQGVLSGSSEKIDTAYSLLRKQKIKAVKLPVAAAFHSRLVSKSASPFAEALDQYPLHSGRIPVFSNTTGGVYPAGSNEAKTLLGKQLENPVNFIDNIKAMKENGTTVFLEAGPKNVLTGLIRSIAAEDGIRAFPVDSVSSQKGGIQSLAELLAQLAALGYPVDLTQWEEPVEKAERKRMRVFLTGANPRPENRCDLPPSPEYSLREKTDPEQEIRDERQLEMQPQDENPTTSKGNDTRMNSQDRNTSEKNTSPALTSNSCTSREFEAMQMIREGLDSIRQLQSDTARAHEKFLETQAETGRVLQRMMSRTEAVTGSGGVENRPISETSQTGKAPRTGHTDAGPPFFSPQEHSEYSNNSEPRKPDPQPAERTEQQKPAFAPERTEEQNTDHSPHTAAAEENAAQKTVLETVSRLTGFPEEMLESHMDIESDLGIDSIKKVEIVSELEKHFSFAAGLTTEKMADVRTISDIWEALGSLDPAETKQSVPNDPDQKADTAAADAKPTATASPSFTGNTVAVLFQTVSNLTGFPEEMLEQDMDLESDLGIDSIKRVEILSALEKEIPEAGSISTDDAAGLKTIRDIAGFLDRHGEHGTDPEEHDISAVDTEPPALQREKAKKKLSRQIVKLKTHPVDRIKFYNGSRFSIPPERKVYITRDSSGLCHRFREEFAKTGAAADIIDPEYDTGLDLPSAGGIVIIADPLSNAPSGSEKLLESAFLLARMNGEHLVRAAEEKASFFATVSFLGGAFGFDGAEFEDPVQGGLAGLAKTADLEWKNVDCKAVDLSCSIEEAKADVETAVSLIMTRTANEIGIKRDLCHIPELVSAPINPDFQRQPDISSRDVFVITGGAKGVTAECAREIAQRFAPTIILVGRSGEPFAEPAWIKGLSSEADIKKALLENGFDKKSPKPLELEQMFRKYMSNREILATLEKIKSAGARVRYVSADVTDSARIEKLFADIRSEFGPVTGIIHGAGILEDQLILRKNPKKFVNVLDTKVKGLHALLNASKEETLKQMICFSSIAARTGNVGQSDYAAANEVLNKTMVKLSRTGPGCRYRSLNWGPWDGGMVNTSLKKEFENRGVDLIDPAEGARQLILEMGRTNDEQVEVTIGADLFEKRQNPTDSSLSSAFGLKVNPETCPVLASHIIDHRYVVPFALLMEWKGYAAEKNNPGLRLYGMDRVRLLKGITLEDSEPDLFIRGATGKCKKRGDLFEAKAAVMSGRGHEDPSIMNCTCNAILADRLPDPPVLSSSSSLDLEPCSMDIQEAYRTVLFHGSRLQKIKSITGVSSKGIEVVASTADPVSDWIADSKRPRWTTDPVLLDAAFQAAIIWTWQRRQEVCLPAFMENFRLYSPFESISGDVRIRFTVNEETEHKIRGYVTFVDGSNSIVAGITGFEAIIHPDLADRFKNQDHPDNADRLIDKDHTDLADRLTTKDHTDPADRFTDKDSLIPREKILAFARGNPSEAFGKPYAVFDKDREMARLPRPPYFFMDRVTSIDHEQWKMEPGGWIEARFDIPEDAWFFRANRTDTIPFCILLEIALQPCGWLAAWAGSALTSDERLYFRNLGGDATLAFPVHRTDGTLSMRCRMTDVSTAGGMILQEFEIEVLHSNKVVYKGKTSFGFFTAGSLANQVGIRNSRLSDYVHEPGAGDKTDPMEFDTSAPVTPRDKETGENIGMPSTALLMIDRIDTFSPDGGLYGNGYIKGSKTVNPDEWFFHAHFYQDPVCPGSLGIESFIQLIRYFLVEQHEYTEEKYQVTIDKGNSHQWKYRGQILPSNKSITVHAHIKEISRKDPEVTVTADGALTVDGICIYEMENFSVALLPKKVFSF